MSTLINSKSISDIELKSAERFRKTHTPKLDNVQLTDVAQGLRDLVQKLARESGAVSSQS